MLKDMACHESLDVEMPFSFWQEAICSFVMIAGPDCSAPDRLWPDLNVSADAWHDKRIIPNKTPLFHIIQNLSKLHNHILKVIFNIT